MRRHLVSRKFAARTEMDLLSVSYTHLPKKLVILDIYENGAYDVQQELKIAYGNKLDLQVELASITNRDAMERVFKAYRCLLYTSRCV